ncbi:CLUMA_CG020936, isoform A [Clunio marinus]|uniref:CLUMA_CG020936, isoform A n=1 Tax=Clunio marinus TaxID=568069 RepID=A0A1J1J728_9DIPT|nr:CLUMA_CG020936, isoform A [Clunio marinus]
MRRWRLLMFLFITELIYKTQGLNINCEFSVKEVVNVGEAYVCEIKETTVVEENDLVASVSGEHLPGKYNEDVEALIAENQKIYYLPSEIENFFPALQSISILNSELKKVSMENLKWFPDLVACDFSGNLIESLDENMFAFNARLKYVLFNSNNLRNINSNVFDSLNELEVVDLRNNICIDESYERLEDISTLKKHIEEKCTQEDHENNMIYDLNSSDKNLDEGNVPEDITRKVMKTSIVNLIDNENSEMVENMDLICEFNETFWEYSEAILLTCNIQNQPIKFLGMKLKLSPENADKIEGLNFNRNTNMKYLPVEIAEVFPNLLEISAKDSYLESISNNNFKGLHKLKNLFLESNDLKIIESQTFEGLFSLEELDLSDGDIHFIEEASFNHLPALRNLDLSANKLKFLEAKIFKGLPELLNISLELNHLSDLDDNLFSSNTKLKNILLSNNNLVSVSPNVFEGMNSLSSVELEGNECIDGNFDSSNFTFMKRTLEEDCSSIVIIQRVLRKKTIKRIGDGQLIEVEEGIRHEYQFDDDEHLFSIVQEVQMVPIEQTSKVPEIVFTEAPHVQVEVNLENDLTEKRVSCAYLDLYWAFSNQILKTCVIKNKTIDSKGFRITESIENSEVEVLSIVDGKKIKYLPYNVAEVFPKLIQFSARNSSLVFLSAKTFEGLESLKSLNLANNNIKSIEPGIFDDLKRLERLDLRNNKMEYIDETIFQGLKSLKALRLGGNKFHFIHSKIFRSLPNLQNISLSDNQLSTIDENLFKTNRRLKNVWIQNNKLKSISPNVFNSARNIEYVDLRDNKCIDSFYESSSFENMRKEILQKCGAGYVIKRRHQVPKDHNFVEEQKNIVKKKKIKEKSKEVEIKEVGCEYEDIFWPSLNETLFTCILIKEENLDQPGYQIVPNINFFALPLIDGDTVQAFKFTDNKMVEFLPDNISESFPNLIAINGSGSSLTSISKTNFKGLKYLKSLDLTDINIRDIASDSFDDLTTLEELLIDNSVLDETNEKLFEHLSTLKILKLIGNRMKKVNPDFFTNLSTLIEVSIDMDTENTQKISEELLKRNENVKSITIQGEIIYPYKAHSTTTEVSENLEEPEKKFEGALNEVECEFLEMISTFTNESLFTCLISDVDPLLTSYSIINDQKLKSVKKVSFDNNQIERIPENLSSFFPQLIEISAVNSSIIEIDGNSFIGLRNLKSLDLSGNKLKHIEPETFNGLESLENLDLSYNDMEFLEEDIFNDLKNLKNVNLESNKLHYLHPKTLHLLKYLEVINIDNNFLSVLEPSLLKHNVKLKMISLNNNKIESIDPEIMKYLNNIEIVSLQNNNCINGTFEQSTMSELKDEIEANCVTEKKNEVEKYLELECEFDEDADLCSVDDQAVDHPSYSIKMLTRPNSFNANVNHVRNISFQGPNIKYLPYGMFEMFPNIEEISASNLASISRRNFANLEYLQVLKLKTSNIDSDSFENLNDLKYLQLETERQSIDDVNLSDLSSLKTFQLKAENIKTLNPFMLNTLPELVELIIDINSDPESDEIHQLTQNLIINNRKLKLIIINGKIIKNTTDEEVEFLPANIGKTLPNLVQLSAENSSIMMILKDDFEDLEKLKFLDLSGNMIENIESETFNDVGSLEEIDLSNNKIHHIHKDAFPYLEKLNSIMLNENQLSFLHPNVFSKLPGLMILKLEGNNLSQSIQDELFRKMFNLESTEALKPETIISSITLRPYESSNEAPCSFKDIYWDYGGYPLFTCQLTDFNNQNVKPSPLNKKVTNLQIDGKNAFSIPQNFVKEFPNLISISLTNTSLKFIPNNLFNLKSLIINSHKIKFIDPNAFYHLEGLEELILKDNQIKELAESTFDKLKNLRVLNLSGNSLTTIPDSIFDNLLKLQNISLENNKINKIDSPIFKYNSKLEHVWLKDNNLKALHPRIFDNLPLLKQIWLEGNDCINENFDRNNISQIQFAIMRRCQQVAEIVENKIFRSDTKPSIPKTYVQETGRDQKLSCNFDYIKWNDVIIYNCVLKLQVNYHPNMEFEHSTDLIYVQGIQIDNQKNMKTLPRNIGKTFPELLKFSARNSSILSVEPQNFNDLNKLQFIDLSNNKIENIDSGTFDNLNSLKELDLSYNQIKNIAKRSLPKTLEILKADRNRLESLSPEILENLSNLKVLSFNGNKISSIGPHNFEGNGEMEILNLAGNAIKIIHPNAFDMLPNLKEIDLIENVCISEVFTSLTFSAMKFKILRQCQNDIYPNFIDHSKPFVQETSSLAPQSLFENENDQFRADPNLDMQKYYEVERKPCKYDETYSDFSKSNLFTCSLEDVVETKPFVIKDQPENRRVKRMILNDNKLNNFPNDIGQTFPSLKELSASNSTLSYIHPEAFKDMPFLNNLDLSDNNLQLLPEKMFDDLLSLEELNLSGNKLEYLGDLKIGSLKSLHLDENKLICISHKAFWNFPNLVTLNLARNHLTKLDKNTFKNNLQLEFLNLKENDIISIDETTFERLEELKELHLGHNKCIDTMFGPNSQEEIKIALQNQCSPIEVLKSQLNKCNNLNNICKGDQASSMLVSRSIIISMNKENTKLRNFLVNSEDKISSLNKTLHRMRNNLSYEKHSNRKLKNELIILENENQQLRMTCENSNRQSNINLECNFTNTLPLYYSCEAVKLQVLFENTTIQDVKGDHARGKRNVDVTSLDVSDKLVKLIPIGIGSHFPNLKKLVLKNTFLGKINENDFSDLVSLKELIILGNDITSIENGSFSNLKQLEFLDLSNNNIESLPSMIFDRNANLKFLYLTNNQIKTVLSDWLPVTNKIYSFSVNQNKVENIDPKILKRLVGSKYIDFTNNECIDEKYSTEENGQISSLMALFGKITIQCEITACEGS